MSLSLPLNPEIRELFDVRDVAEKNFVTLQQAKASAKDMFANGAGMAKITFLVLRADDSVQLISIGPLGGIKVVWKFGVIYSV